MSQDVSQWLAEIQSLKQQLGQAQRDRDEANTSAAKWRQLYTTEAQQRRIDAKLAQQNLNSLKQEIQQLKGLPDSQPGDGRTPSEVQAAVEQLQTAEQLKQALIEVTIERDRLIQALKQEQTNHAQTRQNLTIALGDAIDRLTKEKSERSISASNPPASPADNAEAKADSETQSNDPS